MNDAPSYDPHARRDTPLALKLKERIRELGPLPVSAFVHLCLNDSEHGYYRRQTAIGAEGDFITAPEISQVFGELIGLWAVAVWLMAGSPVPFHLIELGAGRGTLMADALRAARIAPAFLSSAHVSLVDINPRMRPVQEAALGRIPVRPGALHFRGSLDDDFLFGANERGELGILIANELLDVWPPEQYVRTQEGWAGRCVGVDANGHLQFVTRPLSAYESQIPRTHFTARGLDARFASAKTGDIVEVGKFGFLDEVLGPWTRLAALFLDYGHSAPAVGDTVQAVRGHAFEHPLTSPGEADLSAQVDFRAVIDRIATLSGLAVDGPTTQAEFLGRLGIVERASKLMSANPGKAAGIEMGVARLMTVPGMGDRFKAIGVRSAGMPVLPGF